MICLQTVKLDTNVTCDHAVLITPQSPRTVYALMQDAGEEEVETERSHEGPATQFVKCLFFVIGLCIVISPLMRLD